MRQRINRPLPYPADLNVGGITADGSIEILCSDADLVNVCEHHPDMGLRTIARLLLEISDLRAHAADTARLDAMSNGLSVFETESGWCAVINGVRVEGATLRDAIDASMTAGQSAAPACFGRQHSELEACAQCPRATACAIESKGE